MNKATRTIVLMWAAIGAAHAQEVGQSLDAAAQALAIEADALVEGDEARVRDARIAWPSQIHAFYLRRSFAPAWTNDDTPRQLLRAIEESTLEGLDPADYHLELLQQLRTEMASRGGSDTLRAQLELLQTDALLRLAYHLAFGKVDAESFDPKWNYNRTLESLDATRAVETALTTNAVYARLDALKPTHRFYVVLKQELARYRAVEAAGGWKPLPAGMTLKPDVLDERVPVLRQRLVATGDLAAQTPLAGDQYDAAVQEAVRRFQTRMGLTADAAVGARTIEELNVPIADRIRQLRINLDRGRVLLHDLPAKFVIVNIAGYYVYVMDGEQVVWSARAQVGKPYRRTPIFRSEIDYLVLNPTWTVPPGIIRNDILPAARRDPASITRRGLTVLDSSGREIDPQSIDWSAFKSGNIPYTLRQDPGPKNALGRVKFMFPNSYSVYLHDTPSVDLFDAPDRSFSSGCVRVENPLELAVRLLNDPQRWNAQAVAKAVESGRLQNVTLQERVPVLLAYWTAWVDAESRVNFRRDVYGQDAQWAEGLDQDFRIRKRPLVVSGI